MRPSTTPTSASSSSARWSRRSPANRWTSTPMTTSSRHWAWPTPATFPRPKRAARTGSSATQSLSTRRRREPLAVRQVRGAPICWPASRRRRATKTPRASTPTSTARFAAPSMTRRHGAWAASPAVPGCSRRCRTSASTARPCSIASRGARATFPLKQSTLELMTTPQQPAIRSGNARALRGFGWDIDTDQFQARAA